MTRIAFLGPRGTFTEQALIKCAAELHIDDLQGIPVTSPAEAIQHVRAGAADYACVAMENSVDGAVTPTFDALSNGAGVQIYREVDIDISFAIMVRPGTRVEEITRFSTHPVAYQQIKQWVSQHLPHAEFIAASSNAAAAVDVKEGRVDAAAAPAAAARLHDLELIAENVADYHSARTRFVLVGPKGKPPAPTGNDRTAVMFCLPHEAGSLVGALQEFAFRGVSLARIESRPTREQLGTYRFHVNFVGHIEDTPVAEALSALYLRAVDLHFLGSWPAVPGDVATLEKNTDLQAADAWVKAARVGKEM